MVLRLSYRYYWEVSGTPPVPCELCQSPGGHTFPPCYGVSLACAFSSTGKLGSAITDKLVP